MEQAHSIANILFIVCSVKLIGFEKIRIFPQNFFDIAGDSICISNQIIVHIYSVDGGYMW